MQTQDTVWTRNCLMMEVRGLRTSKSAEVVEGEGGGVEARVDVESEVDGEGGR